MGYTRQPYMPESSKIFTDGDTIEYRQFAAGPHFYEFPITLPIVEQTMISAVYCGYREWEGIQWLTVGGLTVETEE